MWITKRDIQQLLDSNFGHLHCLYRIKVLSVCYYWEQRDLSYRIVSSSEDTQKDVAHIPRCARRARDARMHIPIRQCQKNRH